MHEDDKKRCENALRKMQLLSDQFYAGAVIVGYHQFIEIAGFMNEMIKLCQWMYSRGCDFTTTDIQMEDFMAGYIAEKFDCIFGDALRDPKVRKAFLKTLEEKGGWRWDTKAA